MYKIIKLKRDRIDLSVALFETDNPKICLHIVHGAKEHKKRYYDFAQYLVKNGIAVIISDNRGHGESTNENYPLGHMENYHEIVEDLHAVTLYAKSIYPHTKVYMLGHSLGSLFARCYIQKYDTDLEGLILSGTVYYNSIVPVGIVVGRCMTKLFGTNKHTKLMTMLGDIGGDDSWVCGNPEVMKAYRSDPFCKGYTYTNGAIRTIWEADYQLHKFNNYQCNVPDLPILSISGIDDPITGGDKGLKDSHESLKKAGYKGMYNIVYKNMKHEVLNEIDKEVVYKDVLNFITSSK